MYTEIYVNVEIKEDPKVIEILKRMLDTDAPVGFDPSFEWPDHPLFKTSRASRMLRSGSFYHIPVPTMRLWEAHGRHYLSGRADLKNYEGEIEKFFDWIRPHIEGYPGDFIGYSRYEENQKPELFYL